MIFLAAPFNQISTPIPGRDGGNCIESLAPGCFAAFLASRPSVRLVRGHAKKPGWTICRVRPFEDDRGLWFQYEGELPADWTGFSVRLKPVRWRRLGPETFLLLEAKLRHIALVRGPEEYPIYPQTKTLHYKESNNVKTQEVCKRGENPAV